MLSKTLPTKRLPNARIENLRWVMPVNPDTRTPDYLSSRLGYFHGTDGICPYDKSEYDNEKLEPYSFCIIYDDETSIRYFQNGKHDESWLPKEGNAAAEYNKLTASDRGFQNIEIFPIKYMFEHANIRLTTEEKRVLEKYINNGEHQTIKIPLNMFPKKASDVEFNPQELMTVAGILAKCALFKNNLAKRFDKNPETEKTESPAAAKESNENTEEGEPENESEKEKKLKHVNSTVNSRYIREPHNRSYVRESFSERRHHF